MARSEKKAATAELTLTSIELLNGSISLPTASDKTSNNFTFNVGIEYKAEPANQLLFVIVSVEIRNEDQHHLLGELTVSCIFTIANFEEVVKVETDGKIILHPSNAESVNSISISTTRGVMFSTYKGTFLHNAFLPIVDPRSFRKA